VEQSKVRHLYENDARGIYDDELIDEVGYSLLARCQSFIKAVEATNGRATCPHCGCLISHTWKKNEVLVCEPCGWELTWGEYFETIQHKQLSGAEPVIDLFQEYIDAFPKARQLPEKILMIDRLIHGFHRYLGSRNPTRPVAINLIEGRLGEVITFLDSLSYSEKNMPGTKERYELWDQDVTNARKWGTSRSRPLKPRRKHDHHRS
jgi:hypothetical protein